MSRAQTSPAPEDCLQARYQLYKYCKTTSPLALSTILRLLSSLVQERCIKSDAAKAEAATDESALAVREAVHMAERGVSDVG